MSHFCFDARASAVAACVQLMVEEARRQAEAEGLALLRSESNATGFQSVSFNRKSTDRPYKAQVRRGGKPVSLGTFATAEEAALAFARTPEGRAAAVAAAAPPPPHMTAEEARRQAEAEGLALLRSERSASGFQSVTSSSSKAKPYQAQVWRGGKLVFLGTFATAEEAALAYARTPEGRAAAVAAACAPARAEITLRQAGFAVADAAGSSEAPSVSTATPKPLPRPLPTSEPPAIPDDAARVVEEEVWPSRREGGMQEEEESPGVGVKRPRLVRAFTV